MTAPVEPFEAVRARVDAVLGERLYWFPVRHHSPNTARHLRDAMLARRPRLVLIEGPPDATALVPHVVAAETRPPIALYVSFRGLGSDDGPSPDAAAFSDAPDRLASWFPLLPYSPEYVAMRTAAAIGADVVFVDLPHYARAGAPDPEPDGADRVARAPDPEAESAFYRSLAAAAGYRSFDEAWDSLFEIGARHPDHESFRRDLALFCASARATADPRRIATDDTVPRERHMWRTIRAELAARGVDDGDAMVVCGGFHLFMDRDGADPPDAPAGTVYATVTPYSYLRTSQLTGYGAGNRAPRYYQRLWEALEAGGSADDAMVDQVCAALAAGRRAGEPLSSADAIAIAHVARSLAALRRRPHPTLDDVNDAIVTCCCKGDPDEDGVQLRDALRDAAVGAAVGKVTDALAELPLVHDFYAQLADLDLGELEHDARRRVDVDRRDPLGARRSALFHRLVQLDVPLVERVEGDAAQRTTVFKERWTARWTPGLVPALIERNLYGDTIEAAASAHLAEEVAALGPMAGEVTARWRKAVDMDLPNLADPLERCTGDAIDVDGRFDSLAAALLHLQVLRQHAAFRGLRRDVIDALVVRAYGRACFALPYAANAPDDDQPAVLHALSAVAEAVLASTGELDRALFTTNVRSAAELTTSPFLRGAFLGVLAEIRELAPDDLAARVAAHARGRPETRLEAGPFLEGVFAVSKTTIALGADALVAAIDELLRSAGWAEFVSMVPRLRHAFERMHDRQRDSFADRVAARYGLRDSDGLRATLATSVDAAAQLARIDAQVRAIMAEWTE